MPVTLFDNVGLVYHNYVPVWQTVIYAFHIDVLKCLMYDIQWKTWKNEWTGGSCTIAMCLVPHPSQCSTSSWEPNSNHPTATDFSRSCSLWHLILPEPEDFFIHRQNSTAHDSRPHSHSNAGCTELFSANGGLLEHVCMCTNTVCQGLVGYLLHGAESFLRS